jgi:hypothetical protein
MVVQVIVLVVAVLVLVLHHQAVGVETQELVQVLLEQQEVAVVAVELLNPEQQVEQVAMAVLAE